MALAIAPETRCCSRCGEHKPADDFRHTRYCAPCRRAYQAARLAAIRAGTWRSQHSPEPPPVETVPLDGSEESLRRTLIAFYSAHGFTALTAYVEKVRVAISKTRRQALAREGWIA